MFFYFISYTVPCYFDMNYLFQGSSASPCGAQVLAPNQTIVHVIS